jgi:hypothetical protein
MIFYPHDLIAKIPRPACKPHSVQHTRRFTPAGFFPSGITWMVICLDGASPHRSSSLPETQRKRAASLVRPKPDHSFLLGLAPDGGCLAAPITGYAGGLLHHRFTLTSLTAGGMFLWPDPAGCPTPGVTRHPALWSADFPRFRQAEPRPSGQPGEIHDTIWLPESQSGAHSGSHTAGILDTVAGEQGRSPNGFE